MIFTYLLLAVVLLFLNGFFVLAEFAAVKLRPSRVRELIDRRHPLGPLLKHIQEHIDSYLSVCQLGITLASIGLGFVGEPAVASLLEPILDYLGPSAVVISHGVAITIAYVIISFLHIFVGEIVPKSIAIRIPDKSAFVTAPLLRFFHAMFYLPLIVINGMAGMVLQLLNLPRSVPATAHSEKEVRIILEDSLDKGVVSFRRLLLLENVLDFGGLKAKNIMRLRESVKVLWTHWPWSENEQVIRDAKFSRYPLLDKTQKRPLGIIHAKDLLLSGPPLDGERLRTLTRPYMETTENARLEELLVQMQHQRVHVAIVTGRSGAWTGFLTFEDITEQIVGAVEDEFQRETTSYLADVLTEERILLDVAAKSLEEAISYVVRAIPPGAWPSSPQTIRKALLEREKSATTYVGRGIAIPHARLAQLTAPYLAFARSPKGIPVPNSDDKVQLIFVVLTPLNAPQVQLRLISRIIRLLGSEYVEGRLHEAPTPKAIIETIQAGETASLV